MVSGTIWKVNPWKNDVLIVLRLSAAGVAVPSAAEVRAELDGHVRAAFAAARKPAEELDDRFPGVSGTLQQYGIDMRVDPIPVVPAAHYCCGGVQSDVHGRSTLPGLLVAGEVAHTGLHGANRLASNSLLEGMVFGHRAAENTPQCWEEADTDLSPDVPDWNPGFATNPDENVLVTQAWEETRRLMWNYVGIVRSNRRLLRARRRLDLLRQEITHDYWKYVLTPDSVELRNIITVAGLIVECALVRKESRGLHYTIDYPELSDALAHEIVFDKYRDGPRP